MKIYAPAKINLFLQVTGKRKDGYHNLVTLMCCIGLHDTVTLEVGVPETVITCSDARIPVDKTNLAYRAAECFFRQLGTHRKMPPEHLAIHIDKHIPAAAGLGGGSSNAAAVFLGLNRYYGHPFSKPQLQAMGQSIGADVPFFIFRHPAIATGIGDQFEIYSGLQPYHILLVHPGFELSTAEVYENLDLGLTNCKKKFKKEGLQNIMFKPSDHLCNDLETATVKRYPDIALAKDALIRQGAIGALMSGSGPTVFGLFSDIQQAKNARDALKQNRHWRFFLTNIIFENRVIIT